jgi:hypothetical protein
MRKMIDWLIGLDAVRDRLLDLGWKAPPKTKGGGGPPAPAPRGGGGPPAPNQPK